MVCFPLPLSARVTHALVVENLRALGFVRVLANGVEIHLDELPEGTDLTAAGELLVVVDRVKVDAEQSGRLADSLGTAFTEGEGEAVVVPVGMKPLRFTDRFRCPEHPEIEFANPTPQLFSFNNPYGSCPECTGFGAVLRLDESLIVCNPARSLADNAVDPWRMPRYEAKRKKLAEFARREGVSMDTAWHDLPAAFRDRVLRGANRFQGVFDFFEALEEKRYQAYIRVFIRQYQRARTCPLCGGAKLRPEALRVRVAGRTVAEVSEMPLNRLSPWVASLRAPAADGAAPALSEQEMGIAESILRELEARVGFLNDVGLGYLTLERGTRTLSGGEAQRISLSNALGSRLVDTLYVLDEPTIGLHPADNDRLLTLLTRLRDGGNTVIVVEHDPEAMKIADHLVELGPGSGELGGELVFEGTLAEIMEADTLTGRYLSGREEIAVPAKRRSVRGPRLRIEGAREHNLRDVSVEIPLGALTVVSGVSGSGKSTLVHDVLYRALERELSGGETSAKRHMGEEVGAYDRMSGTGGIREVVLVDQSPIGRTPRSNPVTYIKAWDEVRRIFASLPDSVQRGLTPGHFSFNVTGGAARRARARGRWRWRWSSWPTSSCPARSAAARASSRRCWRALQGAQRPRRAGDDGGRGDPLLHPRGPAGADALAPPAGGAGLPAPRPARPHPFRRRGAADQGGARAGAGRAPRRQEAVRPRRAHHGSAHGRHPQAPPRPRRPGRRRPHRPPDRAQPGRHQDRRLADRPRPRRRPGGRPRRGDGDARGGGPRPRKRHRPLPRSAPRPRAGGRGVGARGAVRARAAGCRRRAATCPDMKPSRRHGAAWATASMHRRHRAKRAPL
jgi:excinuclease ABC subunit A